MEPLGSQSAKAFWLSAARSLVRRRNLAFWWEHYYPFLVALCVAATVALVVLRLLDLSPAIVWWALVASLALAGLVVAIALWPKRMTAAEGLSCLDEIAGLRNRLVSARAGIGDWPPRQNGIRDIARWNWPRLVVPVAASGLLLLAAAQTPRLEFSTRTQPVEEPLAWSQVDAWLQTLKENETADPQTLAAFEQQLNELRQKPPEEWFEHNGLEAGDALRQQMEQGLREMRSSLEQGSHAVAGLQQIDSASSLSEMKALSESLQQAFQGMKSGHLPAHPALRDRMRQVSSGNPKQLTAEQLAELQKRLDDGMKTVDRCVAPQICQGGQCQGQPKPGSGGQGGGGKSQPLALNDQAANLQTQRQEASANEEMERALPGDLIAITSSSHDIDRNAPFQPQSGGRAEADGNGGNAVWRDSLTPAERQVLERYFK